MVISQFEENCHLPIMPYDAPFDFRGNQFFDELMIILKSFISLLKPLSSK